VHRGPCHLGQPTVDIGSDISGSTAAGTRVLFPTRNPRACFPKPSACFPKMLRGRHRSFTCNASRRRLSVLGEYKDQVRALNSTASPPAPAVAAASGRPAGDHSQQQQQDPMLFGLPQLPGNLGNLEISGNTRHDDFFVPHSCRWTVARGAPVRCKRCNTGH
jgi:hypothetical protein